MVFFAVLWAGAVWADKPDFAPVPQTGQVFSLAPGDDGALQKGVELPTPRFTDKGNGTIKDNLTGLIWLKNADCIQDTIARDWATALFEVASLNTSGTMNDHDCGDTSGKKGTHQTDWRLPNIRELYSLVDFAFFKPAISERNIFVFPVAQLLHYWSSTTDASSSGLAWFVDLDFGDLTVADKRGFLHVIAVRGGS